VKRLKRTVGSLVPVALFVAACGGSVPAQEEERISFSAQLSTAVWYSEAGEAQGLGGPANGVVAEDGNIYLDTISVGAPSDGAAHVSGALTVDVPDRDVVELGVSVGFATGSEGSAIFRVYVQDGEQFPLLAEVVGAADGRLDSLVADLTPYRGENRLIILSVAPVDHSAVPLWIAPQLLTP